MKSPGGRGDTGSRQKVCRCDKLKALSASIGQLGALLEVYGCSLQDMPCIEVLTALHTFEYVVTDYAQGNRTFRALSSSLPCLLQLQTLRLRGWTDGQRTCLPSGARSGPGPCRYSATWDTIMLGMAHA